MPYGKYLFATSTVGVLVALGTTSALFGACSPSNSSSDASIDAPVCDPDSGDPAGCPCSPSTYKQQTCYTGPPGTDGKGPCQTGTRSCNANGTLTACVGEITPQPEVCNYEDDDCDGIVDDLPAIVDAAVLGNCNSPACSPNFEDAAITCWGPDPGICGAGTKACAPGPKGGTPTGCNEFVHTPAQEICNGIDDDCNGLIDDGLNAEGACDVNDASTFWPPDADPIEAGPDGAQITQVLGECVHGNLACVDYNCGPHGCADAGDQCFPSQPSPETCDGKDNDCNGIIDDHACATYPSSEQYCCTYVYDPGYYFCDSNLQASDPGYYTCTLAK